MNDCDLCTTAGGEILWQDAFCRVVLVDDATYPGFCRVIWHEHIKEMSDLNQTEQHRLMRTVFAVERAIIATLKPDKINLASLGNMTPHLHWHVIPRFKQDAHFPNPIWGTVMRESAPQHDNNLIASVLKATLAQQLS
ncbi:MAG: HIT family protein [Sulfuriferula sp.]|nr:HIT family protein [Sulfuriferula sp.]